MSDFEECSLCGIKSKFLYICPQCGKKYCSKHKKPEDHNCEISTNYNDIKEDEYTHEHNFNADDSISVKINETNIDNAVINEEIIENDENDIENKDDFIELNSGVILEDNDNEKNNEDKLDKSFDINELMFDQFEDYTQTNTPKFNETKIDEIKSSNYTLKILGIIVLVIIVISSVSIFGHLYITDNIKKSYSEYTSKIEQDNLVLLAKYNDLYKDYMKLEEDYNSLNNEYTELEDNYTDQSDYSGQIFLENMRQITIDEESNSVFFYELPGPGYVTIEVYSDADISILIGSSMFEEVYYARYPIKNTATEIKCTVPVLPDLNILISNNNNQKALIFLWIKYNYLE